MTSECLVKKVICTTGSGTLVNSADHAHTPQNAASDQDLHCLLKVQDPVVQSVVSLTSSLRVISLTVLAD